MSTGRDRFDETWHRLRDWHGGQAKSEMLAWQIIAAEGYTRIDPALPFGGPDGGRDAMCERDGETWVMAVYFPEGQQTPGVIKKKLLHDIKGAKSLGAAGIVFVTNQEISLADREKWEQSDSDLKIDLLHLLVVTRILNDPKYAQTCEKFLDIVAGPPPMLIKASVAGSAYAFTDDSEVLDRFVWMHEKEIREESDKGHARVKAEREAKERADKQRRDREAAERRRAAAERPWDITAQIDFGSMFGNSLIMDNLIKAHEPPDLGSLYPGLRGEKPKPPEPLSDEEIQEKVDQFRAELEERWPACRDYLAGVAFPGLKFRIKNEAKSFLKDVQVILTFHGAVGVEFEDLSDFEFEKVRDPNWRPTSTPYSPYVPPPKLRRPDDYPITWHHSDDGDLEVTITLPSLRPHPEWRSDGFDYDVVLVVDPSVDIAWVEVTYTATAQGYGDVFEGEPITVPIERVDMLEVLRNVMEATREAS